MAGPSTEWREQIDPGEDARFARQAEKIAAAHKLKSAKYGSGRFLHRKPVFAARGTFSVLPDLPAHARHGVFAQAKSYPAVVRLSNGGMEIQANSKPDIRGFAIKVEGVSGPSSLDGTTDHQDFLLVNQESFGARTSDEFVDVMAVLAKGQGALLWHLIRTHGLGGGLKRIKLLASALGKPFSGFATEKFDSLAPIAVGPYAARVGLIPINAPAANRKDFEQDMRDRINAGPVTFTVALQFFTDEATTPIENPTVAWPKDKSPFVPVARLTLTSAADSVEALRFDPWGGLADHRPLGELMRSRKVSYYTSQKGRGAA